MSNIRSEMITHVLPPVTRSTAALESAFLRAGEGLGDGLRAFQALNERLAALASDCDGTGSLSAAESLDRLSSTIAAIGGRLPNDARILTELVEGNEAVTAHFGSLTDNMRMITIVSRSARIEAVAFDDERLGLDSFTRAISQQISDVQRDINTCATEHAKLTSLLSDAALTQAAFEAASGGKLEALADELGEASSVIRRRGEEGSARMRDVAACSMRITRATGTALVSLQVGDATRQRLEHVTYAIEAAAKCATDAAGAATAMALYRLAAEQLGDTASCLDAEAAEIRQALHVVADETQEAVGIGTTTYGGGDDGARSFMTAFRSRFVVALDLVGTCEATRQTVERAIDGLRSMLATLSDTIATLGDTSRELVLVGMNVGLKAARLGPEGRSLVVVAEELKRLAGDISVHAHDVLPVFDRIQELSRRFDQDGGVGGALGLDREFQAIIDDLDRSDGKVADQIGSVVETGRDFAAKVDRAHKSFEVVSGMKLILEGAADHLREATADAIPAAEDVAAAAVSLDAIMLPVYTMAREREIHAAVLATFTAVVATPQALAA